MLSSPRKVSKLFIKFLKWGKIDKANYLLTQYPEYELPYQKAFQESYENKCLNSCKWIYEYCIQNNVEFKIDNIISVFLYACDTRNWDFVKLIINNDKNSYNWKNIVLDALQNKKIMEYNYIQLIKLNILNE